MSKGLTNRYTSKAEHTPKESNPIPPRICDVEIERWVSAWFYEEGFGDPETHRLLDRICARKSDCLHVHHPFDLLPLASGYVGWVRAGEEHREPRKEGVGAGEREVEGARGMGREDDQRRRGQESEGR